MSWRRSSRAKASTSSRISRLISVKPPHPQSQNWGTRRFLDVVEAAAALALRSVRKRHRVVLHPLDHAHEIALIADRQRQADLRLLAGETFEIGQFFNGRSRPGEDTSSRS